MPNNSNSFVYAQAPQVVNGYELTPGGSMWLLVVPEAAQNLLTNPSFEYGLLSNVSFNNGSGTLDPSVAMRGGSSVKVTPSGTASASTINYSLVNPNSSAIPVLSPNSQYYFSFDLYSSGAENFNVSFVYTLSGGNVGVGSFDFKAGGLFERKAFSFFTAVADSPTQLIITITKKTLTTNPFWIDGYQLEQKAYPTTFIDGNQPGCSWDTYAGSTSTRSANAQGGRTYNFWTDLGLRLLSQTGAGLSPAENLTLPKGFSGGEYLQRKVNRKRAISLSFVIMGTGLGDLQRTRERLISLLVSNNVTQESRNIALRYQTLDACAQPIGQMLEVQASYISGLEGITDNNYQERITLQFAEFGPPSIKELYQSNASPAVNSQLSPSGNFYYTSVMKPGAGWFFVDINAISAALTAPFGSYVVGLKPGGNGFLGQFFPNNVKTYVSGTSSPTFSTNLKTLTGGYPLGLAYNNSSQQLYVGGTFTGPRAYFDVYGSGPAVTTTNAPAAPVRAMANDVSGNVWIGGDGTTNYNRLLVYTPAASTQFGTAADTFISAVVPANTVGLDGAVRAIVPASNGQGMYIGGSFVNPVGGPATVLNYVSYVAGNAYNPLGSGTNGQVNALAVAPDGTLYAGGAFTTAGGLNTGPVAKWNGTQWGLVGSPLSGTCKSLAVGKDGTLYAVGSFSTGNSFKITPGGAWQKMGDYTNGFVGLAGNNIIHSQDVSGSTSSAPPAVITMSNQLVTNSGSAGVYPKISIVGPGNVDQIVNFTTGKTLYFDTARSLQSGEVWLLDTSPDNFSLTSNLFGALDQAILSGSDKGQWGLLPGQNVIGVLMQQSLGGAVGMSWNNTHWSFDASAYGA